MSRWVIIQQSSSETPGNLTRWLQEYDQDVEVIQAWHQSLFPAMEGAAGLVLMGGTMSANDKAGYPFFNQEIQIVKDWYRSDRPLLGICLGAQIMALALGRRVYPGEKPEIGWFPITFREGDQLDPIFQGFTTGLHVFQWHYDTFDLPDTIRPQASSPLYRNQAFRVGKRAYGLQFHPEMNTDLILHWIDLHRKKLLRLDPHLPAKIARDTELYLKELERFGRHFIMKLCTHS